MKVLIWFLCIFANVLITTLIKEAGVILGAIPTVILYGATFLLARTLCKKWDEHKENKAVEHNVPVQAVHTAPADTTFCRKCGEKLLDNSQFCRKCGKEVDDILIKSCVAISVDKPICETQKEAIAIKKKQKVVHFPFHLIIDIIAIILSVLSILSITIAMNVQDANRNIYEQLNPTILYFVLIGINIVYMVALFVLKEQSILKGFIAFVPVIFSIITLIEGSLFSKGYGYINYINSDQVNIFNAIWVSLSFVILLINLLPLSIELRSRWYHSVRYREKCYMRVAKMKEYLNNGIISQEEFEKNKKEILKNIEM